MESVSEGIDIRYLPPGERDAEVGKLVEPWIGDEGPLDAHFRQAVHGAGPLRLRGVAFDETTTVAWDEAGVQVLRVSLGLTAAADIVTLRSPVILHHRFAEEGPKTLFRIDYLRRGALLGSRFTTGGKDA
jgi:hypothetical protein